MSGKISFAPPFSKDGVNAFLRASAMGRMDICRLLFEHPKFANCGINAVDKHGNNALLLSASYGNSGICGSGGAKWGDCGFGGEISQADFRGRRKYFLTPFQTTARNFSCKGQNSQFPPSSSSAPSCSAARRGRCSART